MAKRTNSEITKVQGVDGNFLAGFVSEDKSLDILSEHVVLPRLKLIQSMSDQTLIENFGPGSVIVRPGDALVCSKDESFDFVPQFFYVEYCAWSDRRDTESPMILERSFDPKSEVARKAKSRDNRFEVYPGHEDKPEDKRWKVRYVEVYNFPGVIYGEHPLKGTPIVISFSKGEHSTGSNFIQAIRLRRAEIEGSLERVPMWAQRWSFAPSLRDRGDKKWWGLDFRSNPESPLIDSDFVEASMKAYHDLSKLHEANRLSTDYDLDEETIVDVNTTEY